MLKKYMLLFIIAAVLAVLAACGADDKTEGKVGEGEKDSSQNEKNDGTRTITQLGQKYEVPANAEKIVVVGAVEALEDAEILGVKPAGAFTTGGVFPEKFASTVLSDAEPIGEKTEPNSEAILKLDPDVILMSTKYPDEVKEKIGKLAPVVPISHISADWKDNLNALAEITGKEDAATKAIADYEKDLEKTRTEMSDEAKEKTVLTLRIRRGDLFIYPEDVFMNDVLYNGVGFKTPDVVKAAKAQEQLPLEKMSDINPDHIFLQYEVSSNGDDKDALKDLEKNPIWNSLKAVKENHVYVNAMDPILEGGPLLSREEILKAVTDKLSE